MTDAAIRDSGDDSRNDPRKHSDTAPGAEFGEEDIGEGFRSYLYGLVFASLLTAASFATVKLHIIWAPAIPVMLITFAIAQMGVHLVFFLHITTGQDNINNSMALAFGVLIVFLLMGGSLWIMGHLNGNMQLMNPYMQMHEMHMRQPPADPESAPQPVAPLPQDGHATMPPLQH